MNNTLPPPEIDELPDDFGNEKKTDECDLVRKMKKELLLYQNGKMSISMAIGLRDICFNVQLKGFSDTFDKNFPPFYTCKSVSNFTDSLGFESKLILNSDKEEPKLFHDCTDGM